MNPQDPGAGKQWTRYFKRIRTDDTGPALRSLSPSQYDALRRDLQVAIDAVLEKRIGNSAARRRVRVDVVSAIDSALHAHSAGSSTLPVPVGEAETGKRDSSVDAAVNRLRQLAQQAFSQGERGTAQSASGMGRVLPLLRTHLMPLLEGLVEDERKVAAFRQGAVTVLGKYMSPKTADRVVSVAVAAALRSVQKRRGR